MLTSHVSAARADRDGVLRDVARFDAERRDAGAWNRRREELRREFLKGAGLWPLPKQGPYRVLRHSLRTYAGYTVENVALETLPGFYCTGNLYRPLRTSPNAVPAGAGSGGPAVLCPHGHFQPLGRFRAEQQIRCAHLARCGVTVFSYGMVGWQDSTQTTHDDPLVLALQTWNSLKALDFLCSLEGVDPERIGMTGASGGGTQTLYLALLDERIKASAPVVIIYPWSAPEGCCRCEGGLPPTPIASNSPRRSLRVPSSLFPSARTRRMIFPRWVSPSFAVRTRPTVRSSVLKASFCPKKRTTLARRSARPFIRSWRGGSASTIVRKTCAGSQSSRRRSSKSSTPPIRCRPAPCTVRPPSSGPSINCPAQRIERRARVGQGQSNLRISLWPLCSSITISWFMPNSAQRRLSCGRYWSSGGCFCFSSG
jgi:hypothetical protein